MSDPAADPPDLLRERAETAAQQLRLVANNVPVLIASYEAEGERCIFANAAYAARFGFTEDSIIGRSVAEVIGEEAAREIAPYVAEVKFRHQAVRYERQLKTAEGLRYLEVHLLPHFDEAGVLRASFVLVNDITRHRLAERAVRESQDRLAIFMQASAEGIVFHKDGHVTDANPPLLELLGLTLDEVRGRHVLSFIPPKHMARVQAVMSAGLETRYELELLHRDGHLIPVEFIVRTMLYNGERLRMTIVRDMRDREAARSRIHYLAHHDALTGLPNRTAFMEQMDALMKAARAAGTPLALLFIDLDHFKRVNDSLGHLAGDALLQEIAQRITRGLRASDIVARFGGDEFMVLIGGVAGRDDIEEVAQKLLQAVGAPVQLDGQSISVTPSVGVAMFPRDGETPAELVKNADAAMYTAKSHGRATCRFFEPEMGDRAFAALVLESQLTQAVARREFALHYQPQVRAADGVRVGAEALIRWRHPQRGLLGPDEFIPLAEQGRLILAIGDWVLREAARAARRLRDETGVGLPVALNLSSLQFRAPGFVEGVARMLHEEGLPGGLLEFELTERMLMDDTPEVERLLARLKALGIRIALDDFGTGYSSLRHLRSLPIDKLKIDRGFVRDLPGSAGAAAITRAIVTLAHSLQMKVIAEGVENEAQRAFLLQLGCDELQGALVGEPQPALG